MAAPGRVVRNRGGCHAPGDDPGDSRGTSQGVSRRCGRGRPRPPAPPPRARAAAHAIPARRARPGPARSGPAAARPEVSLTPALANSPSPRTGEPSAVPAPQSSRPRGPMAMSGSARRRLHAGAGRHAGSPSMNCSQRGHMRHRLRAYLPVRGGHGRRVSQAEGSARTSALNASHTPDRSRHDSRVVRSLSCPCRSRGAQSARGDPMAHWLACAHDMRRRPRPRS